MIGREAAEDEQVFPGLNKELSIPGLTSSSVLPSSSGAGAEEAESGLGKARLVEVAIKPGLRDSPRFEAPAAEPGA